jgi:hypothetical protein
MAPAASGGAFSIIETINAPGNGRPRRKHPEAEIFAFSMAAIFTKWTAAASLPRPAMWSAFQVGPRAISFAKD